MRSPVDAVASTGLRALQQSVVAAGALLLLGAVLTSCGLAGGATPSVTDVDTRTDLPIPELLVGNQQGADTRTFALTAAAGAHDFGAGRVADSIGFNGSYLGPTLQIQRGDQMRVRVRNDLDQPTTVHWHGMALPARMDGGPHQLVAPGARWTPHWRVDQPAATLWYHPHPHGATAQQVYRGLAGMILVRDPDEPQDVPQRYGVDDIPVIVQDKTFTADGQLVDPDRTRSATGFLGETIVTNGVIGAQRQVTTTRLRLRLLNASNARFYRFAMADGRDFDLIAGDGGLLAAPLRMSAVQLSPGERAEIVVEFRPGETTSLVSEQPDLGHGIGTSDRFGGGRFQVLEFVAAEDLEPSPEVPAQLADVPAPVVPAAATVRQFGITDTAINGAPMDLSRIDVTVPVDTSEIWEVTNQNPQPHNFHVHDGSFRVLSIDGADPPAELAGYKDTVYVAPRSVVRLLVRFRSADPDHPYMYHCHLLRHEDVGVMGQFVVTQPGQAVGPLPEATTPSEARGSAVAAGHGHSSADPLRRGG